MNDKEFRINLTLRDLAALVVFLGTLLIGYLTIIKEHENRIVRLETKLENLTNSIDQMRTDVREIKDDIKTMLQLKWRN